MAVKRPEMMPPRIWTIIKTALDSRYEAIGLEKLLQFIDDNHYQIVGPYLGEVVAQMSIFDYRNNNILVKLQIPVKISE